MKKLVLLMLLVIMPFAFLGCKNNLNDSGNTQIANPWIDLSQKAFMKKIGFNFEIPKGCQNAIYRYMDKEKMGEIQFTYDDQKINLRIKHDKELTDISGVCSEEWQEPINPQVGEDVEAKITVDDLGCTYVYNKLHRINDEDGIMLSISAIFDGMDTSNKEYESKEKKVLEIAEAFSSILEDGINAGNIK